MEVGTCNTALLLALLVLSSIRLDLVLLLEVLEDVEAVEELVELELELDEDIFLDDAKRP